MHDVVVPLLSGAFAGLAVDLSLFPLDTLKTRLQAEGGFLINGGYRHLYKGMGSIAAGSAPGAALFFLSYEFSKKYIPLQDPILLAVASGSLAETLACLVRVPTEVIKQRTQVSKSQTSLATFRQVLGSNGIRGLYRGFGGTLAREIPFVSIQFPLWERLKAIAVRERGATQPHLAVAMQPKATPAEAALCGAVAGGIAAACTTPMDVVKTRLMLASQQSGWLETAKNVVRDEGLVALTKGMVPRVGWISVGGFIFLGGYSAASDALSNFAQLLN
ncbi:protein of unknown function [Taphrina deformans PYCC 5710]|uniref:Mitochondrial carrier protein PET8 n=1 Tax=Taphrina deformans (strain PYCC 5710 / ATCC 11124 / CBS 356.35 / IMI 108563 / JCM 9778 / NBRC 8474) TaxID=1097556 RepID=R4XMH9_TAPDE|nr:protein of unknown function [Taphrina deformans PYCC 5710]|eukprot:CCG84515.1 protein of unknown function [Taphrina deformans PYCC 5710]